MMRHLLWMTAILGGLVWANDASAQWSPAEVERVERQELGDFDDKPLFLRRLQTTVEGVRRSRTEVFWVDDPEAFRGRPSQESRADSPLELGAGDTFTTLLVDEGPVGPFPSLGSITLQPKKNLLTVVDWPPIDDELAPYAHRRTRTFAWRRKTKTFQLAETAIFVPKVDRLVRLASATGKKDWMLAWRAALALDPFVATTAVPGCDRIVGHAVLDLLIAHLDVLLATGRSDDAHRILSLAFKFGGARSAACGVTSSGIESGQKAAFESGARFTIEKTCGKRRQIEGKKAKCEPGTRLAATWKRPKRTRAALLSFAQFAASKGDLELVKRLLSGMAERRRKEAAGSWARAWNLLAEDAAAARRTDLAAAASSIALASDGAEDELDDDATKAARERAAAFKPQKVDREQLEAAVTALLDAGQLLLALGEVERYSRDDLSRSEVDVAVVREPVIEAVNAELVRLEKAKADDDLSDWRALRGKARWLNPM